MKLPKRHRLTKPPRRLLLNPLFSGVRARLTSLARIRIYGRFGKAVPFEVVPSADAEYPIDALTVKAKPSATRRAPAKKKAVITVAREGSGPFGLAKGAPVDTILTEWNAEAEAALTNDDWVGLDLETSGLLPRSDWISVVGLHSPLTRTAVVLHVKGFLPPELITWLGQSARKFVTHNGLNFDILFLAAAGVAVDKPTWFDTLVGEQVVTGTDRRGISKKLQDVVKRRVGTDIYKDVDHRDWLLPELSQQQIRYVAEDISFLTAIREAQYQKALEVSNEKWNGRNPFFGTDVTDALHFEHSLLPVVLSMEMRGLPIDEKLLLEYSTDQWELADVAKAELDETFGEINWQSPKQVKDGFRNVYGVELPSTREEVLMDIAQFGLGLGNVQAICETILAYRHAAKRAGMYNGAFYDKYARDGWLRADFRPCGTDTGRFSSANPNLQQLPKNKGKGGGLRHVIGNREGFSIVSADYSQIEVRIAADIAEEWALIELFKTGDTDIHTLVASTVFGKPTDAVSKDERQLSKAMSFTLLFGGGAAKLSQYAKTLGADLPMSRAVPLVTAFFDRFPELRSVRERAHAQAASHSPYTLHFPTGIRRVLTPGVDQSATRILNNQVQGTAAAGLKYALLETRKVGVSRYIGAVVHDEIVCAVPTSEAYEVAGLLRTAMITGMEKVCNYCPVDVEVSVASTWG